MEGESNQQKISNVVEKMISFINEDEIDIAVAIFENNLCASKDILQNSKLQHALEEYHQRDPYADYSEIFLPKEDDYTTDSVEARNKIVKFYRGIDVSENENQNEKLCKRQQYNNLDYEEELEKLVNFVQNCAGKEVAIFSHIYPDCDAYASQVVLGLLMEKLGAKVSLYNTSANQEINHDETLRCLGLKDDDGNDLVNISSNCPKDKHFDHIIVIDCDIDRVGRVLPDNTTEYVRLDHHKGANFSKALASCEFIGYLYERLKNNELLKNNPNFESNILLDKSLMIKFLIPSLLYTGCYTDTRSFRVADTKSFHQLREMLEHENNVLSPDIISNMLEYASPVSYRGKFADYLVEHNRVKILIMG